MSKRLFVLAGVMVLGLLCPGPVRAEDASYELVIKDHRFSPAVLTLPAGKKVKVIVRNQDASPEEFESYALNREKVVAGGSAITLFLGPLKPGAYKFFGDFHPGTAQGSVEVK